MKATFKRLARRKKQDKRSHLKHFLWPKIPASHTQEEGIAFLALQKLLLLVWQISPRSEGKRKETDKLLLKTANRGEGRELLCAEIPRDYGAERRRRW